MKVKGFKLGILALIFILSIISLIGCGSKEVSEEEVYIIGTDAAFPPFEMQDGGKIVGFDIDIIEAIAEEVGIKIEVKHTGWDPLFEGINNETVDAGIAAITITEDRKQAYDFSAPYFEASQLIMLPKDSKVTSMKDLEGEKIGVQSGTTGDFVVQEQFGKTYKGNKGYEDIPAAVDDLLIGRIDAVVADNAVIQEYLKILNKDGFKLIKDDSFEVEYYGIITKKGNSDLLEKLNEGLKVIKENGKYDEIFNKYFAE